MRTNAVTRRVLFLISSARADGNAEQLARLAAKALSPSVEQRWVRLSEQPMPPFEDLRHSVGVYPAPEGVMAELLEATLWATDVVFVAPVYWYSLPAAAKLYLDHWSGWLRVPGLDFKARMAGRALYGISVASGESDAAAPLIGTLERTAQYLGMRFGGVLLGNGSKPGEVLNDRRAIHDAEAFLREAASEPRRTAV
jgi:multimeric flavodoxin WrbA